ncbi:MAG: diaminopimelate epimerase [Phycisphaerales bacterium]
MRFVKMHGIGNDYVYVDAFTDAAVERRRDLPALARAMSDRHRGIGSDGLILLCRPTSNAADVRMRMFNADGSESEMCGNGVRCVAKFAHDRLGIRRLPLRVQTGRGVLAIDYVTADSRLATATVDMGEPVLSAERIPVELPRPTADGKIIDFPLARFVPLPAESSAWVEEAGLEPGMTCVSMGNPHVVLFCARPDAVMLERLGPYLETQPIFPNRVNVHVVAAIEPTVAVMRTWERGAGLTMACGTGACAALVAGVLTNRLAPAATMRLPGGELAIKWDRASNRVLMTGPAEEVYSGDWPD